MCVPATMPSPGTMRSAAPVKARRRKSKVTAESLRSSKGTPRPIEFGSRSDTHRQRPRRAAQGECSYLLLLFGCALVDFAVFFLCLPLHILLGVLATFAQRDLMVHFEAITSSIWAGIVFLETPAFLGTTSYLSTLISWTIFALAFSGNGGDAETNKVIIIEIPA